MLVAVQGNLANTYQKIGRIEEALNLYRDVYSGRVRLKGEEDQETIIAALNYASSLVSYGASKKPSHCSAKLFA